MKKTPKKRNPQDTTLRNARAAKKRIEALEARIENLETLFMSTMAPILAEYRKRKAAKRR